MKKTIMALTVALTPFLMAGSCDTGTPPPLLVEKWRVVDIPPSLYKDCKELDTLPKYSKLRDKQVAELVIKLYINNKVCKQSIDNIVKYMKQAKETVDGKPINLRGAFQ